MSASVALLVLTISFGIALALLLARRSRVTDPLPDSQALEEDAARLESYLYMHAPTGVDDAERRLLMRQQLIDLRRDFLRFWRACRLLAPYSDDPEFGTVLLTRIVLFHRLWLPLWIGTHGWVFEYAVRDFARLVQSVEQLRTNAHCVTRTAEGAAFENPTL